MARVTFTPDNVTVEVPDGETLLRAAMAADVRLNSTCGGGGTCGKCRVAVTEGSTQGGVSPKLTAVELERGYVLACLAEIAGDVVVRVPPESRPGHVPTRSGTVGRNKLLAADESAARLPVWELDPPARRYALHMDPPDISDITSDVSRVVRALSVEHDLREVEPTWDAVRATPAACREGDWTVTALVIDTGHTRVLLDVVAGDRTSRQFAVAVDIGTTTVACEVLDLTTGAVVARDSEYNAQAAHGADVINRIVFAGKGDGLDRLQNLVTHTIVDVTRRALTEAAVDEDDVIAYVVAGNTTMTHLFFGLSPASIRTAPYVPAATSFPWVRAADLSLPGCRGARVLALPCVASYVGGDITAGVLSAGIPWSEGLTLFIDVGTNGEMVLGGPDWLIACSCSAGPAFEGGGMLHGMRASTGAIELVRVDPETFEPMAATIGGVPPQGICGSAFIDAVAELFCAGALDQRGKFRQDLGTPRIREGDHGWEYVLAHAEDTATGGDIVLTEVDIDNLIRAKAAVFAGIDVLVESVGVSMDDIGEIAIAGGFGHYLEVGPVTSIGLLPEMPVDRFVFLGNASLAGARLVALSREMQNKAVETAQRMTYLELSVNPKFMDAYTSGLFLPHTDTERFPSVCVATGAAVGRD